MICSKCGTENPEGNRYCGECGNRLVVSVDALIASALRLNPDDENSRRLLKELMW